MAGRLVVQELQLLPPTPGKQLSERPAHLPNNVTEQQKFKNKLQEYTQKLALQLPVYQTINEGFQHAPKFRSTVFVDGTSFKSPGTFPQRKLAEQDAARVALEGLNQKIKDDGRPLVCEDTTFCKSILNEYAVKMHVEKPTYQTTQSEGMLPTFSSSVNFNGVSYNGGTGRSKKEAEQLAARAAILSILDSEPAETISKIIKSKCKLYTALNKAKDKSCVHTAAAPVENTGDGPAIHSNKRKETEATSIDVNQPITGFSQSSLDGPAKIQLVPRSIHEFKKPRPEIPIAEVAPPIVFVTAGSEQLQHELPSTLGVKRSRKSKKKAKKRAQVDAQMLTAALPLRQFPPCSVAQ